MPKPEKYKKRRFLTILSIIFLLTVITLILYYFGVVYHFSWDSLVKTEFINFQGTGLTGLATPDAGSTIDKIPYLESLIQRLYDVGLTIFQGLAVMLIVYYGIRIMLSQGDSKTIGDQVTGLVDAVVGFLFLNIIGYIVDVFDPLNVGTGIVSQNIYETIFEKAVSLMQYTAGVVAFVMFFIAGYKLLMPADKSSEAWKSTRSQLVFGILGLFVVMLSQYTLYAIVGPKQTAFGTTGGAWGALLTGESGINQDIMKEIPKLIFSVLRVILYFYMPIAVVIVIYAGAQLVFKGFDDKTWASTQKILKNVFISIIILLSAYTLIAELIKFLL